MKFLETITFIGYDVFVPIDRIKYINVTYREEGWQIDITSDDGNWTECFQKNEEKLNKRLT